MVAESFRCIHSSLVLFVFISSDPDAPLTKLDKVMLAGMLTFLYGIFFVAVALTVNYNA